MKNYLAIALYTISYITALVLVVYGYISSKRELVEMGISLALFLIPPLLVFLFYKKK